MGSGSSNIVGNIDVNSDQNLIDGNYGEYGIASETGVQKIWNFLKRIKRHCRNGFTKFYNFVSLANAADKTRFPVESNSTVT